MPAFCRKSGIALRNLPLCRQNAILSQWNPISSNTGWRSAASRGLAGRGLSCWSAALILCRRRGARARGGCARQGLTGAAPAPSSAAGRRSIPTPRWSGWSYPASARSPGTTTSIRRASSRYTTCRRCSISRAASRPKTKAQSRWSARASPRPTAGRSPSVWRMTLPRRASP